MSQLGHSLRSFSASGPPDVRCCSNSVIGVATQQMTLCANKRHSMRPLSRHRHALARSTKRRIVMPMRTARYLARFHVTVPIPPLEAVGVIYLSSSLLAVTISRFCSVPFQFGNVALSTRKVSVLSVGLAE